MFAFDSASLPQLTTRKALICVDFQNDFTTATGALPVLEPDALLTRTAQLANNFRSFGDVVWVQSRFEAVRSVNAEQILASDLPSSLRPNSRSRRRVSVEPDDGPPDQEAFLSQPEPLCVKADSEGSEMPSVVKDATQKNDMVLTKSHYSAFNSTHLLRVLRAKMVMEVFICGSLANIGVYATALDAAGHGMTITIVEDCCGFRSDTRQAIAVRNLIDLTGCEIASSEEVLESLKPKPPKFKKPPPPKRVESSRRSTAAPPTTPSTSASASTTTAAAAADEEAALRGKSETPEVVKNIRKLRLASDEPIPVATTAAQPIEAQPPDQPYERAPATSVSAAAERHESLDVRPSTPPSKGKESIRENESPTLKVDKEGDEVEKLVKKDEGTEVKEENEKDIKQSNTSQSDNNNDTNDKNLSNNKSPITESKSIITPLELTEDTTKKKNTAATPESEERPLLQRGLCEGDTDVIENVLPACLEDGIFDKLRDEIQWQRMSHQGGEVPRLVAVQGLIAEDGSMPVYRHPSDESPALLAFTPTVLAIKAETEKHLGHPLNHVLIQFYRDGNDYISEHSDKTLDIVQGSFIANVSLGAERTMVLRTKRLDKDPSRTGPAPTDTKRQIQRARLPHNSLCRMGLKTNMKWLHAIRQDKRADRDKTPAELAYKGGRISLTFRQIGTFLNKDETLIWGQGATGKTREEAQPVINGQSEEAIKMLRAFGTENHASEFDWAAHYGKGFDVLHMSNAPRLFASPDPIVNNRIALMLAEHGINYAKGSMGATKSSDTDSFPVKFVDNDAAKSTVQGDMAIMLYLNAQYGAGKDATAPEQAKQFTRFQQGLQLLDKYRALEKDEAGKRDVKLLNKELEIWNTYAGEHESGFLAGEKPTLPDFTVWPVLHALVEENDKDAVFSGLEKLKGYYERVLERDSAKKILQK